MDQWTPTITAAAIVTVLIVLIPGIVSIINANAAADERLEAKQSRAKLEELAKVTDKKADTLIEKAVEIHTLTNSNLSKVTESLNVALKEIDGLKKLVESQTKAKDVADNLAKGKKL